MRPPFSIREREAALLDCAARPLDLVIIGGGITGAGILRDAALRGFRAALFEKEDFAHGTSSRSSKLIHGGLRYLETYDFRLVYESLRERHIQMETAAPWVQPLPFLFPVYSSHRRSLPLVSAGIFLYSLLSGTKGLRAAEFHFSPATLELEPLLRPTGLRGSVGYLDAWAPDASLVIAVARSAWNSGGIAVNHAEVKQLLSEDGHVRGVVVHDHVSGTRHQVRSRWVVNATGPWSDRVRESFLPGSPPHLRTTRGVHLVFDRSRLPIRKALVLVVPSDQRVAFALPEEDRVLLGTTDTDDSGDPSGVAANDIDVRYLLETARHYFPTLDLRERDIVSTFAGLRPLLRDNRASPSATSREHRLIHERSGFVSICGGKLTTYRKMAEDLMNDLVRRTPEWRGRGRTSVTRTLELGVDPFPAWVGADADTRILAAFDQEMAVTVADVLDRRLGLTHSTFDHGLGEIERVKRILTSRFGTPLEKIDQQISDYRRDIHAARAGLG